MSSSRLTNESKLDFLRIISNQMFYFLLFATKPPKCCNIYCVVAKHNRHFLRRCKCLYCIFFFNFHGLCESIDRFHSKKVACVFKFC